MNNLVVCILMYIKTYGVLDVCSTRADPTVKYYSGLNIALSWRVADPGCWSSWLWQCTSLHVLMPGSPVVQPQPCCSVTRKCESVSWECTKAQQRRDWEEGRAATKGGAELSARGQNCGKGLRRYTWHACIHTTTQTHLNPKHKL